MPPGWPRYPVVYEINTRVWVRELSAQAGRRLTLDTIPPEEIEDIAARGFDAVWLMGVWTTGLAAIRLARGDDRLRADYRRALPDLTDGDVIGSPYAVSRYQVSADLGGPAGLAAIRAALATHGVRLMLDFVPNHTATDHNLLTESPQAYVRGTEDDIARDPQAFYRTRGGLIVAHGRDPSFPPWQDTAQIDYGHRPGRAAMLAQLQTVAQQCDGVRCDMAMLVLPEVIERTWGERLGPDWIRESFWTEAIPAVRERHPGFLFLAEAYWGLEWILQQQGFDFTYDKVLYDRLLHGDAPGVRAHLFADPEFRDRCARFLENHDEPRAAAAFGLPAEFGPALVTSLASGMRLLHEGQLEGRRMRLPVQLGRRPEEAGDETVRAFYARVLAVLRDPVLHDGTFVPLDVRPAGEGDPTWDNLVAFAWREDGEAGRPRTLVVVNLRPQPSWARIPLGAAGFVPGASYRLLDRLDGAAYARKGDELCGPGLFVALAPRQSHLFSVQGARD
ncbi:MAG: alpha-amylase [Acidobacteria bacterium]|nr:MAG: alpha-amylase [Acidobacteriota bacterium]